MTEAALSRPATCWLQPYFRLPDGRFVTGERIPCDNADDARFWARHLMEHHSVDGAIAGVLALEQVEFHAPIILLQIGVVPDAAMTRPPPSGDG